MKITAILNGYNRPQNIPKQIEALKTQTIPPTEIMLWYNQGVVPPYQSDSSIKAAYCNHNFKFHGRFAYALLAQTEYIALFDDDTIPGKKWFENCLNTMKTHPGILGSAGVYLTTNKYFPHDRIGWNGLLNIVPRLVDLVGHAWFMKRDYLKYLWYEAPVSWENGEDIQLSYLAQKHGGIKTYVPPHPENEKELWGSILGNELGRDQYATFKKDRTHGPIRDRIVEEQIKRGWQLARNLK